MTQDRRIILNFIATYGRNLFTLSDVASQTYYKSAKCEDEWFHTLRGEE